MDVITLLSQKRTRNTRSLKERAQIVARYLKGTPVKELFPDAAYPHSVMYHIKQSVLKAAQNDPEARKVVEEVFKEEGVKA